MKTFDAVNVVSRSYDHQRREPDSHGKLLFGVLHLRNLHLVWASKETDSFVEQSGRSEISWFSCETHFGLRET